MAQFFHTIVHSVSHHKLSMLGGPVNRPQYFVSSLLTRPRLLVSLQLTCWSPVEAVFHGAAGGWNPIHERETVSARDGVRSGVWDSCGSGKRLEERTRSASGGAHLTVQHEAALAGVGVWRHQTKSASSRHSATGAMTT